MRFLAFADMQLHRYPGSREADYLNCFEEILESAVKHQVGAVVFAGDLFESPQLLDQWLLEWTRSRLARLTVPFIASSGNHDNYDYARTATTLNLVPAGDFDFPNPFTVTVQGVRFVVVHYDESPLVVKQDMEAALEEFTPAGLGQPFSVLVAHQTVRGTSYRGMHTDEGLDGKWMAKHFNLSIVGHVHDYQWASKTVLVPGSPLQNNKGDAGQKRGWHIFDVDPKSGAWSSKFILSKRAKVYPLPEEEDQLRPERASRRKVDHTVPTSGSPTDALAAYLRLGRVHSQLELMSLSEKTALTVGTTLSKERS